MDSVSRGLADRLVNHQNPTGQRAAGKGGQGRRGDTRTGPGPLLQLLSRGVLGYRRAKCCRNSHVGMEGKEVVSEGHDSTGIGVQRRLNGVDGEWRRAAQTPLEVACGPARHCTAQYSVCHRVICMRPLEGGGEEESKRLAYLPLLGLPRSGPEPGRILCVPRWAGLAVQMGWAPGR